MYKIYPYVDFHVLYSVPFYNWHLKVCYYPFRFCCSLRFKNPLNCRFLSSWHCSLSTLSLYLKLEWTAFLGNGHSMVCICWSIFFPLMLNSNEHIQFLKRKKEKEKEKRAYPDIFFSIFSWNIYNIHVIKGNCRHN